MKILFLTKYLWSFLVEYTVLLYEKDTSENEKKMKIQTESFDFVMQSFDFVMENFACVKENFDVDIDNNLILMLKMCWS